MLYLADKISFLRSVSLFAELNDENLAEVAGLLQSLQAPAGTCLFEQGDPGRYMYILVTGRVRVHTGELTLNYINAGEVFGDMALLDSQPRMASATVEEDSTLLGLEQGPFFELLTHRPGVMQAIIRLLNRRVRREAQDRATDFAFTQQMNRVTAAAAALEAGRYDPRILDEVCKRSDELGQLARVFHQMAGEVAARQQLQVARRIQASFLPQALPELPGWEMAAFFEPARDVAGDFYDVFPLCSGCIGIVIADVCDKGVGAALFMATFRTLIRAFAEQLLSGRWLDAFANEDLQPAAANGLPTNNPAAIRKVVESTNNYVARTHAEDSVLFATLFFGVIELETGCMVYVNGGHEPPLIAGPEGVRARLARTGPALGVFPDVEYGTGTDSLAPGETLLAVTDGVTDALDPQREPFGSERVQALVAHGAAAAAGLSDEVAAALQTHMAGGDPLDDITLLVVRRAVTEEEGRVQS